MSQFPTNAFIVDAESSLTMLGYEMGGLLGYYSLINLLGSVYSNTPLNAKFKLTKD